MSDKKKVVVGMSGGVDSSVAAYLLKEAGYEVIGATMKIWESAEPVCDDSSCCGVSAVDDARRVANKLDIPYYVLNFEDEFKKNVKDYFVEEYLHGRTPNPCIACNRYVKWESLLQRSLEIGADFVATGHYAKVVQLENGRYTIANSVTAAKDQTYALYNLTQEQLKHTLMPVGAYTKDEIRQIAAEQNLTVAKKPDSQDICFIPDHDYGAYIESVAGDRLSGPGDFVLTDGTVVGQHKGITHYTVGQRKHLGIALGRPIFVKQIDVENNRVILGDDSDVFTNKLTANNKNCMAVEEFHVGDEFIAKIRYSDPGSKCIIAAVDVDTFSLEFPTPVRAVTPGQAVVLYTGEYVAGGGTILF